MEHFDVIIVGAGVSGIGAACHLRAKCPDRTFAILEGRSAIGGTWDLFRYPGIRSDSDMHTFGYDFKPWKAEKSIADGESILSYLEETAAEHDVMPHVRFQHHVTRASWSTGESRWTVEAERQEDGEDIRLTCNFLFMCSGYYSYAGGYTPDFAGIERFGGPVVHPQAWPEDLDYADKRVAVIGSGATAMTLVPAMAEKAARVTMIQRSPTYVISLPARDAIANRLRRLLPEKLAYAITRWKNVLMQRYLYRTTRVKPEKIKRLLLDAARKQLGDEYVDKHFTPSYNPWDQRLCLIPDGDLFRAISSGKAEVVTDTIAGFDSDCVRLSSGQAVQADILVTATGLNLEVMGGIEISVDGEPVPFSDTLCYKGMMYADVPNLANVFGYVNASWTLRADLTCAYVCRLLNHMTASGARQCTPRLREQDRAMEQRPWIVDFMPGYMARSMHLFPRQGNSDPWRNTQNYLEDRKIIYRQPLEDGVLTFSNPDLAAPVEDARPPRAARTSSVA